MSGDLLTLFLVLGSTFLVAEGGLGTSCNNHGVQDIGTCDVPDSYCGPIGSCVCLEGYSANSDNTACESYFNCLNDGCKNGAECVSATGACQCGANQAGFDCAVDTTGDATADLTTSGCETCNTTGTFMCSPSISACYCKYGYTGSTCTDPRVVVEVCDNDSMKVNVQPYINTASFNGLIYIYGKKDDANCAITQTGDIYSTPDFQFADCARKVENNQDVHQIVDIVVQTNEDYLTSHNIIHQAKCILLANGNFVTEHITAVDPLRDLNKGSEVSDRETAIDMVIEGVEVEDGSNTYQLGTELTVKFTLHNTDDFKAFKVTQMSTRSSTDEQLIKELIAGRCPDPDSNDVLQPNPIDISNYDPDDIANKNIIQVKIYAHKFSGSDGVKVTARALACTNRTVCEEPSPDCNPHTRRRRTTSEKENEFTMEKTIKVIDTVNNGIGTEGGQSGNVMTSQCKSSPEYISTVTILAGLLALTYFALIIFCLCLRRHRRKKHNSKTTAEKLDYHENDMTIPRINFLQKYQSPMSNPSYE
ncbi:unnamed protein product [Owenia fusiformis]|uniref:Uncharacterized protein n=1 Tax=Owenia fusiformis TaxID=6347 RepID=A0A8J1Y382_OWEFU|nr:unnamed protein product [Owenia fusiformis]